MERHRYSIYCILILSYVKFLFYGFIDKISNSCGQNRITMRSETGVIRLQMVEFAPSIFTILRYKYDKEMPISVRKIPPNKRR